MQKLTLEGVKAAAADWYRRGKLIAQSSKPYTGCYYVREDGCRCAIGAALTDETLKLVTSSQYYNGEGIQSLRGHVVEIAELRELDAIIDLQRAHDAWAACAGSAKFGPPLERKFCEAIGVPYAEAHA